MYDELKHNFALYVSKYTCLHSYCSLLLFVVRYLVLGG